jgi:hypothetical protein
MGPPREDVRVLVEEVLGVGMTLFDLLSNLLEMVTGSVLPATDSAGERAVREATALVGAIRDRVFADLRAAAELAGQ